jgi:hypothetical protein
VWVIVTVVVVASDEAVVPAHPTATTNVVIVIIDVRVGIFVSANANPASHPTRTTPCRSSTSTSTTAAAAVGNPAPWLKVKVACRNASVTNAVQVVLLLVLPRSIETIARVSELYKRV